MIQAIGVAAAMAFGTVTWFETPEAAETAETLIAYSLLIIQICFAAAAGGLLLATLGTWNPKRIEKIPAMQKQIALARTEERDKYPLRPLRHKQGLRGLTVFETKQLDSSAQAR